MFRAAPVRPDSPISQKKENKTCIFQKRKRVKMKEMTTFRNIYCFSFSSLFMIFRFVIFLFRVWCCVFLLHPLGRVALPASSCAWCFFLFHLPRVVLLSLAFFSLEWVLLPPVLLGCAAFPQPKTHHLLPKKRQERQIHETKQMKNKNHGRNHEHKKTQHNKSRKNQETKVSKRQTNGKTRTRKRQNHEQKIT